MPSTAKAEREIRTEFELETGQHLNKRAAHSLDRVFKLTVGPFLHRGHRFGVDGWKKSPKFRRWILTVTRQIARAALKKAGARPLSNKTIEPAAVAVMKRWKKTCDIAWQKGRIIHIPQSRDQGDVCADFLADKM